MDTMYNYEIEKADLEFLKDEDDNLWLLNFENVKVNIREGYEETASISGITYCHPIGHDPELENQQAQAKLNQDRFERLALNYEPETETNSYSEHEEKQMTSKEK